MNKKYITKLKRVLKKIKTAKDVLENVNNFDFKKASLLSCYYRRLEQLYNDISDSITHETGGLLK